MLIEADRDLLDWSGKKALEYQKQMTTVSVSASTYSSEYKILDNIIISNIQTLPNRQNTMKKKDRGRYTSTTGIVQRSYSLAVKDVDNKANKTDQNDTESRNMLENSSSAEFSKRKDKRFHQSFLRKKISMRRN